MASETGSSYRAQAYQTEPWLYLISKSAPLESLLVSKAMHLALDEPAGAMECENLIDIPRK